MTCRVLQQRNIGLVIPVAINLRTSRPPFPKCLITISFVSGPGPVSLILPTYNVLFCLEKLSTPPISSLKSTSLSRAKTSLGFTGRFHEGSGSMCRYSHSQSYGQQPRAKKRQQYLIPVVLARVSPWPFLRLQRVWDSVVLVGDL